ncbi:nuclear transport factor 2 family protein [Pelobium manganitolerans]|uniref:nuclear transport factor 2 family protein n=1 Tax=Pelobium manganitolerans TaxID=1842495 RepID=UPI003FA35526
MKEEILNLEKKYWEAMAAHDYETVRSLTRFPCIVAGKHGVMSVDQPEYQKMFEQGKERKMKVGKISEEQIDTGEGYALIAYKIELDYNGKMMQCACTSTWLEIRGNWLCAMHTETDLEVAKS